ncbi:MAG TPA: AAA family ATPase [Terriglobales bacterium]|nr:AAA family ATPase [Terriglobales bacterium]
MIASPVTTQADGPESQCWPHKLGVSREHISTTASVPAQPSDLKRKWAIYTPGDLRQRCQELRGGASLIAGLIPNRSLSLFVGDSGLGKSPLLYQAALCVASGLPFLGQAVSQGTVLYLDFENGLGDVDDLTTRLSLHLGLADRPEHLLLWNYNDAPPKWESKQLLDMSRAARPVWIIIDSLSAYAPEIEEKASNVTRTFQEFRKIIRECGIAITVVHHIKKPSTKPAEAPPALEEDPRRWFQQTRGSGALVNGSDVRIGIDHFGGASLAESREIAFVIAGFGRVRGRIPTAFVARKLDEDGEPLGYEALNGASLLFNSQQEETFDKLPPVFRFKEAQRIYGRGPQATTDFLKKCINVGILRKDGRDYRKLGTAE